MDELQEEQAEALVESLGRELHLDRLIFDDDDHSCSVQLDEENLITLTWVEDGSMILLDELIITLSLQEREDRQDLVEKMLEANVFWMGSRGATLSMHSESGVVIAARQLPVYRREGSMIQASELAAAIRNFADVASQWRSLLKTGETAISSLPPLSTPKEVLTRETMGRELIDDPEVLA